MPDTCEILIAIVHLARGLTLISSPALILHRKWLPFPGDCQLIFTGLENSYCRSNTSSSSTPQVTCLEVQTRGPNSCTLLILDVQPGCNVTWSRHSNVARPAAPSCWWGIWYDNCSNALYLLFNVVRMKGYSLNPHKTIGCTRKDIFRILSFWRGYSNCTVVRINVS